MSKPAQLHLLSKLDATAFRRTTPFLSYLQTRQTALRTGFYPVPRQFPYPVTAWPKRPRSC